MARISDVTRKEEPAHYVVAVRKTIDFMKEYAAFAQQALGQTEAHLRKKGLLPISGPVVFFHNVELEALDVEMGWQVVREVECEGDLACRFVPAQTVVTAIDMGPYEEQDPTLEDIFAWMQKNGCEAAGPIRYCYLNDTERPPAQFLTQMSLPVKD